MSCPNPRLVQETTLLSIIIISRNQIETIDRCLTSVQVATALHDKWQALRGGKHGQEQAG